MIGNYAENGMVNRDTDWPAIRAAAPVFANRCASCHDHGAPHLPRSLCDESGVSFWQPRLGDPRLVTSRHLVFNLSRPEKSLILLAPWPGSWRLGTLSRCQDEQARAAFATTTDPDYRKLLAMCEAGKQHLDRETRFDMPGFRPRGDWVRELTRFRHPRSPIGRRRPHRCLCDRTEVLGIALVYKTERLGGR